MKKSSSEPLHSGEKVGRWTVLDGFLRTAKGERKLLCQCACGKQRYVLERSLKQGTSRSCGCLRRENVVLTNAYDLTGEVFGELTVLDKAAHQRKNGGVWWLCRCACGEEYEVPGTLLVTGRRTHCSGAQHEKKYAYTDISGQRFGRLVALCRVRDEAGRPNAIWRCRCDCGRETAVSYNALVHANQQSCGCRKKEHEQVLHTFLTHMCGTSLDLIKSTKVPSNSTTGARGVYLIKGKYVAKVNFQKKAYYLGAYTTMEEALRARKEAEEALYQSTLLFYAKWQERAEEDPDWAVENPVQIIVTKSGSALQTSFLPVLEEN